MNQHTILRKIRFKKNSDELINFCDILKLIDHGPSLFWMVENMEVLGNLENTKYPEFALLASDPEACYPISWETMFELTPKIDSVIWINFVGFKNASQIKEYSSDCELLQNSYIAIFRFDGAWWDIFTQDEVLFKKIEETFLVEETTSADSYYIAF